MSKTPVTDLIHDLTSKWTDTEETAELYSQCRAFEAAGNALHERLEHWIQMNSGICDPKDVAAIEAWKEATK